MIIELLLSALYNLFSLLTTPINIPTLPTSIQNVLDMALGYISAGVGILANYTHIEYLLTLFGIIILIDVGLAVYKFVMWVIRKIPMINIS